MSFGDISSSDAVIKAIEECRRKGEKKFLRKYGFGKARKYFLYYEGECYPSKAIMGVAHKYQFPCQGPLIWDEFPGGKNTVVPKLEKLKFTVRVGDC